MPKETKAMMQLLGSLAEESSLLALTKQYKQSAQIKYRPACLCALGHQNSYIENDNPMKEINNKTSCIFCHYIFHLRNRLSPPRELQCKRC